MALDYRRMRSSLVEVTVSSGLVILLSMLIANAWTGLGRPLIERAHRCRVAQESTLALACLASDLGGCLPGDTGALGGKSAYQLVGRMQPGGTTLWLCFDGGATPNGIADWVSPDLVITYQVSGNTLVRSDVSTGADFVAARNVASLAVADLGGEVQITLSLAFRGISETYILVAIDP